MIVDQEKDNITLVVVDDHPIVRSGLVMILNEQPALKVAAVANGYEDLFTYLKASESKGDLPDIILLDQSKTGLNSFDILGGLKKHYPSIKTIVMSMTLDDFYAVRAMRAGAAGYITRESAIDELVTAIHEVHRKGMYISPDLAKKMIDSMGIDDARPEHEKLSNRELQVLNMIARGKKLKEIAEVLSLSPATIATYRARILEKMKLKSNVELANYAARHHLGG